VARSRAGFLAPTVALVVLVTSLSAGNLRARAAPGAPSPPARAPESGRDQYALSARLLPEQRLVLGTATIHWQNRSQRPVDEIWLHLYANAFKDARSVFMREHGESLRGTSLSQPGGIEIVQMRSSHGDNLLARARTDVVAGDATQMRVALDRTLPPGGWLSLELEFRLQLPSIVARMGAARDFFMLGQWFPKLAKLEPDGRFASFPYHGVGEFYADFADYDLSVEVPADFVVAAPGDMIDAVPAADGFRRERYRLRSAIDVAWAASSGFARTRARAGAIGIDVFAPIGQQPLAREQAELLRQGIGELGSRLGSYPYSRLVLVLPPGRAHGAAGMEYPGLIVGWPVHWHTSLNPIARAMHRVVTLHELAHQWFAMLVASDEVSTPVLDEGLAQWVGLALAADIYDRAFFRRLLGVPIDLFEGSRLGLPPGLPSSLQPAHAYRPAELGPALYLRPALALETIARCWGRSRLWGTLAWYARAHRFAHPKLSDLWAAFDRSYWPGFSARVLRPALEGAPFSTRLGNAGDGRSARDPLVASRSNTVAAALPLRVEQVASSGARTLEAWASGRDRLVLLPRSALRGASIDPDRRNLLDDDRSDDQSRGAGAPAPPQSLLLRLLFWAQALLMVLGT
jgi:hypothetical protein